MRRRILLGGALGLSGAAVAGLGLACLELYRREQRVRLQPTWPVPPARAHVLGRAQVLFLGDSRMQEWPDLPQARFVTVNAGGGGETTAQVSLRAAATLDAVKPEIVVLQAGINDLKTLGVLPDRSEETEARCLANLVALVELCRARGARVVLVPVLATTTPSVLRRLLWSSEIEPARLRINAALRRHFAGDEGVKLLDDQVLVPDTAGDYRDTLHFSRQGYAKLEKATLAAIGAP